MFDRFLTIFVGNDGEPVPLTPAQIESNWCALINSLSKRYVEALQHVKKCAAHMDQMLFYHRVHQEELDKSLQKGAEAMAVQLALDKGTVENSDQHKSLVLELQNLSKGFANSAVATKQEMQNLSSTMEVESRDEALKQGEEKTRHMIWVLQRPLRTEIKRFLHYKKEESKLVAAAEQCWHETGNARTEFERSENAHTEGKRLQKQTEIALENATRAYDKANEEHNKATHDLEKLHVCQNDNLKVYRQVYNDQQMLSDELTANALILGGFKPNVVAAGCEVITAGADQDMDAVMTAGAEQDVHGPFKRGPEGAVVANGGAVVANGGFANGGGAVANGGGAKKTESAGAFARAADFARCELPPGNTLVS